MDFEIDLQDTWDFDGVAIDLTTDFVFEPSSFGAFSAISEDGGNLALALVALSGPNTFSDIDVMATDEGSSVSGVLVASTYDDFLV